MSWLERLAEEDPLRPFLTFGDDAWSYGEVWEAAGAWAGGFLNWGLEPGDRVALYLSNRPEFVAAYLGVLRAGGVMVPVNRGYRARELAHILGDSGARLMVTEGEGDGPPGGTIALDEKPGPLAAPPASAPAGFHLNRGEPTARRLEPDALAILAYTSGTTGRAKGAMLTHGNLAHNARAVRKAWGWTHTDRLLLTLPLFHVHGLCVGLNGTLAAGAAVDLWPAFDAARVLQRLGQGGHSMFFGVPTMYTRLLAAAADDPCPPPPVRLYVSGSAPLSPDTFRAFERRMGHRILERYGMTETLMNMTNPLEGERVPGSVGRPFPGQEARVVHTESGEPLGAGKVGEIQVRGPNVFAGYWGNARATSRALVGDGWFNTGDLGWCSEDGGFTLHGRARELIISGGFNIYPLEVEEVLLGHPGVAEAAVVGRPHADLGEAVTAVVVPAPDAHQQTLATELVALCREKLAAFKKPRQVEFVRALPRNALGKVQKHLI